MDKKEVLRHYFGYGSFRGGQESLIDTVLSGRDALGIMPTGGGKSICYQIPALMLPGITVVVSPLISLMKDQVMSLKNVGVAAAFINSSLSFAQLLKVYDNLRAGKYKVLYIAPERLQSEGFAELARHLNISLVAVDEAHCVSQWGNDFRPSYLKIADFVESLDVRPILAAFTATATDAVRLDIISKLKLRSPSQVITGFDRPNLRFSVIHPKRRNEELLRLMSERGDRSGIIYCMTRNNVEKVCKLLCENGYPATAYHAGMEDSDRRSSQDDFVYDRKPIIVATNAFGMGIDKSNVSFVIHYNMPMSLEAYYQEAGRAGRDGEEAECILMYSPSDIQTARMLIDNSEESEEITAEEREELRRRERARLEVMIGYCKTTKCLRGVILDYFGQKHSESCGNCGNCQTVFSSRDVTVEAQKILSCIRRIYDRLGYYVGIATVIRTLHGIKEKRIFELGLEDLTTYGLMKDMPIAEIRDIASFLSDMGYMEKDSEYGTARLTPLSYEVLRGEKRVIMDYREQPEKDKSPGKTKKSRAARSPSPRGGELYERLRSLRGEIASEQRVPAYIVFSNATLADMADKKPTHMWELMEVSGVGRVKAASYGKRFLAEISAYLEENER